MISSVNDMEPGDLYTTDGKDAWTVQSFCDRPTVTLKNLKTGETKGGGVGCLLLTPFVKLVPEGPAEGVE